MQTFESLGLQPNIVKALQDIGFETPTPIQAKVIPQLLTTPSDITAFAQTGTGKTAAFGLPLVQNVDANSSDVQAIILCPTRELCLQISKELNRFLTYVKNLKIEAVYGGENIGKQIRALAAGPQIIVGTPGRTIDLIKRKKLKLDTIDWLVLDEADEMLTMGFKEELDTILAETPQHKHTLLFSATMPPEINNIAQKYMRDPISITTKSGHNVSATNVEHLYCLVRAKEKYEALKRILDIQKEIYGIVFCRTRRETQQIANYLLRDNYKSDALHGDMSQAQRDHVMERFRNGSVQLLVATDVAARGIDVQELTHVINFSLPDNSEAYIHRSGRTGRAGKEGTCISLVHSKEKGRIKHLERKIGKPMTQKRIPNGKEICERKLVQLIEKVQQTEIDHEQIEPFLGMVYEKLGHMSWEDLIQHFVSTEFNRILSEYGNAPDLNTATTNKKDRRTKDSQSVQYTRFFISLGEKNKLTPPRMIGIINDTLNRRDVEIGKIEILRNFSFFDIDETHTKDMVQKSKGLFIDGELVTIEVKKGDSPQRKKSSKKKKKKKRNKQRQHS